MPELQGFAYGARVLALYGGGFALPARRGRADFAHGGVAGALASAPHVPTGDGAVGAPTLAKGEKLLGSGHVFFAVGDGPTFSHAQVVDGKDVRAAEAEDQEHLDGPGADAADGSEPLDELFVGEPLGLVVGRNHAGQRLARQILHRNDFCAGESCFAQNRLAQLQHFFGRGRTAIHTESPDAGKDGGGGFAGDGLVGDGFQEDFVGAFGAVGFDAKFLGFLNQRGKLRVLRRKRIHGQAQVEWRQTFFRRHEGLPELLSTFVRDKLYAETMSESESVELAGRTNLRRIRVLLLVTALERHLAGAYDVPNITPNRGCVLHSRSGKGGPLCQSPKNSR